VNSIKNITIVQNGLLLLRGQFAQAFRPHHGSQQIFKVHSLPGSRPHPEGRLHLNLKWYLNVGTLRMRIEFLDQSVSKELTLFFRDGIDDPEKPGN
jgi:hypothetical protein